MAGTRAVKKAAVKKAAVKKAVAKKAVAKKAVAKPAPPPRAAAVPSDTAPASTPPVEAAPPPPIPIRPGLEIGRPMQQPKAPPKPAPAVREDETAWTSKELQAVRVALLEEYARLEVELRNAEAGLADLIRDSGDGSGDDQADAGNKTFEREHEMSLANNAREMMLQVQHALVRIDDGTYGACEGCGKPIGKLRLQAFPRATLCLACKQAEERF